MGVDSIVINPITGMYQEMYAPEPGLLLNPENTLKDKGILDANLLFWADLLSISNVTKTINQFLQDVIDFNYTPIYYKAIITDPKIFIERVQYAKVHIADQGINIQEYFSHIETLNIFCKIYNSIFYKHFSLSIQQGWRLSEDSAQEIYQNCLDQTQNPYLQIIKNHVIPVIKDTIPKIVFLLGRPGYFCFALSRLIKQIDPTVFICVTRHSSEYYSLNKIDFLLRKNIYLFKDIDAVILEHFLSTEKEIIKSIIHNFPITTIKNLILSTDDGSIQHTGYQHNQIDYLPPDIQYRSFYNSNDFKIPPNTIVNIHLFPNMKCYWNKCNFCGINQKYHFENNDEAYTNLETQLNVLRKLIDDGISRIWFIDEAFPPSLLRKIGIFFNQIGANITWQARCRIEPQLLEDDLPELLTKSGLRELRLGLESGSESVLRKINKFDDNFSFQLVNELCHRYSKCGISLHFPIITGLPIESKNELKSTYELLTKLSKLYPLITFNINIFGLDVSSKLSRNWIDFDIQSISFPCEPVYYLGNALDWYSSKKNYDNLSLERDQLMRNILYPWMPSRSLTQPHIFYRLSETIRNTLIWKDKAYSSTKSYIYDNDNEQQYKSDNLTIFYDEKITLYYIYSWSSHHYMLGNDSVVMLLEIFKTPKTVDDALDVLRKQVSCEYTNEDFKKLIEKLVFYQHLIKVKYAQ